MTAKRKCGVCGGTGHNARSCGKSKKKGKPKSWIKEAASVVERAESRTAAPEHAEAPDALPPLDLTGFVPETPTEEPKAEGVNGDKEPQSEATSSGSATGDRGSQKEPSPEERKVANEKLVAMGAGMWCSLLAAGSQYAEQRGFMGLGEVFIEMNRGAATILLDKMLKDSEVNEEEFAAMVCAGSGAFVGFNAYKAYAADKKKEKGAEDNGERAAGESPAGTPTVVNGAAAAAAQPVTGLVVRDAQPKTTRGSFT